LREDKMPKWFIEGGVMMYPLLLCSVILVAVVLERFYSLSKTKTDTKIFMHKVKKALVGGQTDRALSVCDESRIPLSYIFKAGITRQSLPKEEIEKAIEDEANHQIPTLQRFLKSLAIISNIAPLIGFLGTVTGLYSAFMAIVSAGGVTSSSVVAAGIAEALITTVAGLCIAIPTVVFHGYFISMVDGLILEMEKESMELRETLKRGG